MHVLLGPTEATVVTIVVVVVIAVVAVLKNNRQKSKRCGKTLPPMTTARI